MAPLLCRFEENLRRTRSMMALIGCQQMEERQALSPISSILPTLAGLEKSPVISMSEQQPYTQATPAPFLAA